MIDAASDVAAAVMAAIGLQSEAPTVESGLRAWATSSDALVVLDNCEHVSSDAERAVRLLLDHGSDVSWSYGLLSPVEASVLRAISVFCGTFDLTAAAYVADLDEAEAADALSGPVDDSLVIFDHRSGGGYRLLETVRAFAAIELERAGARELVVDRHLAVRVETCVLLESAWLAAGMHEAIEVTRGMVDDLVALVDATSNTPSRPAISKRPGASSTMRSRRNGSACSVASSGRSAARRTPGPRCRPAERSPSGSPTQRRVWRRCAGTATSG